MRLIEETVEFAAGRIEDAARTGALVGIIRYLSMKV